MQARTKRITYLLAGIAACVVAAMLCWQHFAPQQPAELTVALYPYVPDTTRFEDAVSAKWESTHPDIKLTFVSWDCYDEDPPEDVDVFVFDSIFLAHFVNQGFLLPISDEQISDRDDILPFALEACTVDDEVYALPEFLCSDILYTRKGDNELSGIASVAELHDALGDHTYEEVTTSDEGLLMDLTGNTTKTLDYLQAVMDSEQQYETAFPELTGDTLNEEAEESLRALIAMGASWDSESLGDVDAYYHAKLFAGGAGRAYIGYSEAMSVMGDYASEVNLNLISMGGRRNLPVFFADLAGVNAQIDEAKRAAAFDLLNVITSCDMMVSAISPSGESPYPQYLLPARTSTYDTLASDYPVYGRLKELVETPGAQVMQLTPDGRTYLEQNKYVVGEKI